MLHQNTGTVYDWLYWIRLWFSPGATRGGCAGHHPLHQHAGGPLVFHLVCHIVKRNAWGVRKLRVLITITTPTLSPRPAVSSPPQTSPSPHHHSLRFPRQPQLGVGAYWMHLSVCVIAVLVCVCRCGCSSSQMMGRN